MFLTDDLMVWEGLSDDVSNGEFSFFVGFCDGGLVLFEGYVKRLPKIGADDCSGSISCFVGGVNDFGRYCRRRGGASGLRLVCCYGEKGCAAGRDGPSARRLVKAWVRLGGRFAKLRAKVALQKG